MRRSVSSFELPNHYPNLTAKENLDYFSTLYSGRCYKAEEVLEMVGLEEDRDKMVKNFSKGMKIRMNMARSILHRPEVLFLDEPTSGLDPVNAKVIKDLIVDLKADGATVFITTHNMAVADDLCDHVAFITDGTISIVDTPTQLKKFYGQRDVVASCRIGEDIVHETFAMDGLAENAGFIDFLKSGDRVEAIHSQETTLEDVFIKVTGEELK